MVIDLTPIPPGIYARVGTPGQERVGTPLDTQVATLLVLAEREGYRVSEKHIYRDTVLGRRR